MRLQFVILMTDMWHVKCCIMIIIIIIIIRCSVVNVVKFVVGKRKGGKLSCRLTNYELLC